MLDTNDIPSPSIDPSAIAIDIEPDDDLEHFVPDPDEVRVAAHTTFSWTVKFTVSGTWVADGFNLDHERAMEMLRGDLGYAHEFELGAQVLTAPPPQAICAMQGEVSTYAQEGQSMINDLLDAAVARVRKAAPRALEPSDEPIGLANGAGCYLPEDD